MNRLLFCLFFVILYIPLGSICAQDFPMLHYTIEDGLPSNTIYHVYKDHQGFLWFATDKGVVKYNGLKFDIFTTFNGLPDNEVFFMKEDYEQRIWFGTYSGDLCFYKDGKFHTAADKFFLKLPFRVPHIYNITLEKDSSVTFNFFNTNILVNIKKEKLFFYNFNSIANLPAHPIRKYIYYKRRIECNLFELVYQYEILYVDTLYNILKVCNRKMSGPAVLIPSQDNNYFLIDGDYLHEKGHNINGDNYIYSETWDTIHSLKKAIFHKKTIHAYYTDNTNSFLATNEGLIINDTLEILSGANVSSLTQDNYGNYWLTTLNKGIFCLRKDFLLMHMNIDGYKQKIKYCTSIGGNVFFYTNDNNGYKLSSKKINLFFEYKKYSTINSAFAKEGAFLLDRNIDFLYYFDRLDVIKYNIISRCAYISKYYNSVDSSGIKEAFLIKDKIYIKGRSNIVSINYEQLKKAKAVEYRHLYNNPDQRIYGMAIANDSCIWFSSLTNMFKLENNIIVNQPQFSKIALKFFIFFNNYMVGYTHSNQLLVCNNLEENLMVDTIPQQNCIWDKIYVLNSTSLLISTNKLYRLLLFENKSIGNKFSISIIENPYIPIQAEGICVDSMHCYFFKNGSITSVSISSLLAKSKPPKLFFTVLKAGKKTYQIADILQIPYSESSDISIAFSSLVVSGQQILQQYSITKNGQDNWVDITGEEISLANPGYGDYIIKLRAKTLSSDYCTPIEFKLCISKPYWVSWWFILLVVCICAGIIFFVIRYRIGYILRKNDKEHKNEMKFVRSEYKALNALMNPHFVFNTLNNVQGLVNRNDKLAANEYIRVFADIIRQNMHNLSKELIPLQKEIDLVVNYLLLEKLRFKDLLNYSLHIDENLDLTEIMVPPLLVQPLVENSIKHGILPLESIEGCVQVNIYERMGILYIEVKDNGVGMEKSREKSKNTLYESFGMDNIMKRIHQLTIILDKKITLHIREESEEGSRWTIVTICMPNS